MFHLIFLKIFKYGFVLLRIQLKAMCVKSEAIKMKLITNIRDLKIVSWNIESIMSLYIPLYIDQATARRFLAGVDEADACTPASEAFMRFRFPTGTPNALT